MHEKSLWMAWQPIVGLEKGEIVGHEALVRGPIDSPWALPDAIFARAARLGQNAMLETICRRLAFAGGHERLPESQRLFVNVNLLTPGIPLDPGRVPLPPHRVAIEISEAQPILDNHVLLEQLAAWRDLGYWIVVDDYGTGYAGPGAILAIQPDIMKLDRRLISGIDSNMQKRQTVRAVRQWTHDLGIILVAEGIETLDELRVVQNLGVDYGQGYLLGRPERDPIARVDPSIAFFSPRKKAPLKETVVGTGFHQAMLDLLDDGVYYVDRRRRILVWNRGAERITGFAASDVVGKRCLDRILNHEDENGIPLCYGQCPLVKTMADGQTREATVNLHDRERRLLAVSVRLASVRDDGGAVIGGVEIFRRVDPSACGHESLRWESSGQ